MSIPIAVIDTSVLVSNANRECLITAAYENLYRPIWSPWIIAELNRVLTWNWIRKKGLKEKDQCSRRHKNLMSLLTGAFECVDPKPPWQQAWPELTDLDDLPIWTTARFVGADYIVSGNTNDFPPEDVFGKHTWEGIECILIQDFMDLIGFEIDDR